MENKISDLQIIDFVRDFTVEHRHPPAYRDFLSLGLSSVSHVYYRIGKLVATGRLGYTPGIARSIYVKEA